MPARKRRKRQTTTAAPGWAWMLFGLSIGLAVALVVYLQSGRPQADAIRTTRLAEPTRESTEEPVSPLPSPTPGAATNDDGEPAAARADEDLGSRDDSGTTSAPRFEFYESLADFEVVVPQSAAEERAPTPRAATDLRQSQAFDNSERYMIQAGSFRAAADADSRKASLALLGIESQINRVTVSDAIYNRVMIGPISERSEYDRITRRLKDAKIEAFSLVLRD